MTALNQADLQQMASAVFEAIDRQIWLNRNANLFAAGLSAGFSAEIEAVRQNPAFELLKQQAGFREQVIAYTVQKVLSAFYDANQFIEVSHAQISQLHTIYQQLFDDLYSRQNLQITAEAHYNRLILWLISSNPYLARINPPENESVARVVCANYSPAFQLEVLGIQPEALLEPVLDLGCGDNALLVSFLREKGVDAHGLDRSCNLSQPWIKSCSWFETEFKRGEWGTILSNMAFSVHFMHHQLRDDGGKKAYALKYAEIVRSLKPGGSFYYAPSLPQMESLLPDRKFSLNRTPVAAGLFKTHLKRL